MQLSDVLKLQEKTWTAKGNGVNAVINTVHKATQGNYGWQQPVNITDLAGTTMDISFQTEYPESLLTQNHVGKRAIWRLKWWKGRRGQNISGYPEQQLAEDGQPEKWQLPAVLQTPQNQQQAPPQTPQATKAPQPTPQANKPPDWDAIAEGKVRHGVVCALLSSRSLEAMPVTEKIDYWVNYIITGKVPDPNLKWEEKDVCPHCGKPHPDCSCTVPF